MSGDSAIVPSLCRRASLPAGFRLFCGTLIAAPLLLSCGGEEKRNGGGDSDTVLRMKVDRVGMSGKLLGQISQEYFEESGVRVEFEATEMDTSVRLTKTQQYLNSRSTGIDVFEIDVIWPGLIGDQLLDLTPSMKGSFADFLPSLIQNNTYTGRLVAIPYYVDFGLLYYRTDLLAKYGYEAPPATWAELEEMAARIQAGEREAGVADFHGFVFHGAAREGLTCAFLEWSASDGGGTMVEPDGTISINNPKAAAAIDRATAPAARLRARRDGPAWASRFTWQRTAEQLVRACAEVVSANDRPRETLDLVPAATFDHAGGGAR